MILLKLVFTQSSPQSLQDFLLTKLHQHGFTVPVLQKLFFQKAVSVDQTLIKDPSYCLKSAPHLIKVKLSKWPPALQCDQAQILYIDHDLIIVNKPAGITTHNDHHHRDNTVSEQMRSLLHFPISTTNPGIVHRLDKLTSGLLILARHQIAAIKLKRMFARHLINRTYLALTNGLIKQNYFTVNAPLAKSPFQRKVKVSAIGKTAESLFVVKHLLKNHTFLSCKLKTGRTHQIRVHLAFLDHPIVNDPLYQEKQPLPTKFIYLHAAALTFYHPFHKSLFLTFQKSLPDYFLTFMVNNI